MPITPAMLALASLVGPPTSPDPFALDRTWELIPTGATNGRTMDAELGDLDGDADLDLVLATEFGQNVVCLWEGEGAEGRFVYAPHALPGVKRHDTEDIAIADFDGDGDPDLIMVAEDDQTNEFYLNRGDATFEDASDRLPTAGTSNAVLAFDPDADGDIDVIIGNAGANVLLLNDGAGAFTVAPDGMIPDQTDTTQDIEGGDIDGDGDVDLIIANETANRVWINDGSGRFTDQTEARLGLRPNEETREADLGDVDADGDLDLVFANVTFRQGAAPARDRLLLNDGDGRFTEAPEGDFDPEIVFTLDADFADLDNDGDLDIITACFGQGFSIRPVRIYVNDGDGAFTDATDAYTDLRGFIRGVDVECADLDGDGWMEVYITSHASADALLSVRAER